MNYSEEFTRLLQACITPMVLISSVGLLLLSLNNRLGRAIDRTREILDRLNLYPERPSAVHMDELAILYRRCRLLRSSIVALSSSIFCSSLLVLTIVIMNVSSVNLTAIGFVLLVASVIAIIFSSYYLLWDVLLTLKALRLEVRPFLDRQVR